LRNDIVTDVDWQQVLHFRQELFSWESEY